MIDGDAEYGGDAHAVGGGAIVMIAVVVVMVTMLALTMMAMVTMMHDT